MIRIDDSIITMDVLQDKLGTETELEICPRAKVTPLAKDYLRDRGVTVTTRDRQADPLPSQRRSLNSSGSVHAAHRASPNAKGRDRFRGIFCPNIVIFDENNRINFPEMERYLDWLIGAGIHGLYPNGSTGEFVRLSFEERQDVVRCVANVNQGRVPILAGASEANVREVLKMADFYCELGVDAISLVPPFYYPVSDASLSEYFAELGKNSPLDILLYNIPQFTQELTLDIMQDLLVHDRIIGTKDSSRDLPRLINTMHRLRALRPDYVVLVGCEEILYPSVMMGASGGTIATSGIIPEVIVDIYEKSLAGDTERARVLQYRILDLINLMLLNVNFPEGFKTGVGVRGFDVGPPRAVLSAAEKDYLLQLENQIRCILSDMGYGIDAPRACPVTNLPPIVDR